MGRLMAALLLLCAATSTHALSLVRPDNSTGLHLFLRTHWVSPHIYYNAGSGWGAYLGDLMEPSTDDMFPALDGWFTTSFPSPRPYIYVIFNDYKHTMVPEGGTFYVFQSGGTYAEEVTPIDPIEPTPDTTNEPPTVAPPDPPTEAPWDPPTEAPSEPPTMPTLPQTKPPHPTPTQPSMPTEPPQPTPTQPTTPTLAPTKPPHPTPTQPPTPTEPPQPTPTQPTTPTLAPTKPPHPTPTQPPPPSEPPQPSPTQPATEAPSDPPAPSQPPPWPTPPPTPTQPPQPTPTEPPQSTPTQPPRPTPSASIPTRTEPPQQTPTQPPQPTPTQPPTPTPTVPTPTVPAGGFCGNEQSDSLKCGNGLYCQPLSPFYYQCHPVAAKCATPVVGIDYNGEDIKTIIGLQPSGCCDACADTAGCTAYTFDNFNLIGISACYLKRGMGEKRVKVGVVSSTVLSPKPSKCALSSNVDFYGNDLFTVYGLTPEQCCDKCSSTPRCKAFTHANALLLSACYLKTSDAGKRPLNGAISGVVVG